MLNEMSRLQDYTQQVAPRMLEETLELVALESPSEDRERVNQAVRWVEKRLDALGVTTARVLQNEAGDQLIARWGNSPRATLLLGHLDTVWEVGQLARMPIRVEKGKAYGPGIYDMKSGAVLMVELFEVAARAACKFSTSLVAFFNSDEETGSRTSRGVLEKLAWECDQVLVFEPSLPGGKVKTSRKGVGDYRLEIFGKSAHAGANLRDGISAIEEFAHQLFLLQEIVESHPGATVNIGVVRGGTRSNVVADYLQAEIDIRVASLKDGEIIEQRLKSLKPHLAGATIQVAGGINRPPLERDQGVVQLFAKAAGVAREQGWTLQEGETGGGSDGSFTAAMGIPTLDGLGPDGDGAHALHEHIVVDDLSRRLALAAGLLERL
ncbi:MAG: M20 family metallopeptidase [Acidobacteria bacterium]|nr:M20 family metallopeptidase [Acidobacteriota bacterium]